MTFESIDDIERSDGLSLGVFRVGDGIADDTLKEYFEDTSGFLVDEARDTLDTTTTCETTDCGFGNSLCKNKPLLWRRVWRTYGCCLVESYDDV